MKSYFLFILIGFFCVPCALYAQEFERKKDSTERETKKQYEEIKEKTDEDDGKIGRFLRKVLTKDPNRKSVSSKEEENKPNFNNAQGKIVRNIEIVTLDPFGYSVSDTAREPEKWIERASNSAHIKSSRLAIRNYLLFRKNKPLDSAAVFETERILRSQKFVRRVRIEPQELDTQSDSIDIKIRVLDSWSTLLVPSLSSGGYKGQLRESNFLGLGHSFINKVSVRTDDGKTAYSGNYTVPNIYNTYISSNLRFSTDLEDNHYKKVAFDRPFYSVMAKWAGGVELSELYFQDSIPDARQNYDRQPVKYFKQRYWGGYSVPLIKNPQDNEADFRMIASTGYESKNFSETPSMAYDSVGYYANERHLLFKIALSSNRYVQDRYVFKYDEIEDIPVGRVYSITTGARRKHHKNQLYLGLRYSFGNYHRIGYLSADIQVGSYFSQGQFNQGALNLNFSYFTPVIDVGSWRFRHFITQSLVYGFKRDAFEGDNLSLLGEAGIEGYNETVDGNKKAILTLQTQTYSPWVWLGFRFNPFFNTTFGVVAEEGKTIFNSPLHTKIGLGVLITNDYFVIDRFQLSLSYYPHIPSDGSHIFKINSLRNHDLRLSDFNSSRPDVVPYTEPRENRYP